MRLGNQNPDQPFFRISILSFEKCHTAEGSQRWRSDATSSNAQTLAEKPPRLWLRLHLRPSTLPGENYVLHEHSASFAFCARSSDDSYSASLNGSLHSHDSIQVSPPSCRPKTRCRLQSWHSDCPCGRLRAAAPGITDADWVPAVTGPFTPSTWAPTRASASCLSSHGSRHGMGSGLMPGDPATAAPGCGAADAASVAPPDRQLALVPSAPSPWSTGL